MDRFTCRDCRCSDNQLHVHHEEHIYSAFSRRFYRNFDVIRLKALCDSCHKKFHRSHTRGRTHFVAIDPQNPATMEWAALQRQHDELKECPFCFGNLLHQRSGI
jgi:hypothetical protein